MAIGHILLVNTDQENTECLIYIFSYCSTASGMRDLWSFMCQEQQLIRMLSREI